MIHKNKIILMVLISGACSVKPAEQERMKQYVARESAAMDEPSSTAGTKAQKQAGRTAATQKAIKQSQVTQLQEAEKNNNLCPIAARLGRGLRALPKAKGPINRNSLLLKCGDYFLENNHPQAYAAVTGLPATEDVQAHFNKDQKARAGERSRFFAAE